MAKEALYRGTITVTRTIEVLEDGHNWSDKVTITGLPKAEVEHLWECDLLDLNEDLEYTIGNMPEED